MCNGTKETIQIVNTCRMNISSFGKRSQEKMCKNFSPCQGEHLVYHCVRYKDEFVEVCAPSVLITGNFSFKDICFVVYITCITIYKLKISPLLCCSHISNCSCSNRANYCFRAIVDLVWWYIYK